MCVCVCVCGVMGPRLLWLPTVHIIIMYYYGYCNSNSSVEWRERRLSVCVLVAVVSVVGLLLSNGVKL